jgi:predicted PurR-regulated permease PerM
MSQSKIPDSSASVSLFWFGGIILLLLFAKVALIPLAFALTLSFTLVPAVARLERRGIRRNLAVAIVSGLTCLLLLAGTYVLTRQILSVARTLPNYSANMQHRIESLHSSSEGSLEAVVVMLEDINGHIAAGSAPHTGDAVRVQIVGDRSDQLQATVALIGNILEPFGQIAIVVIFTIYILMNREDLRHRLLLLAGMGNINVMTQALEEATARISQYLVMQFQVNACYGVLFGAGLYLLHVPQATLWAVIAGALRIVPYVGTFIGMVLPLTLSIAVSSNWWHPLLVIALFLVLETTTGNVIEPWLFSSRTGISSLALLGSAIFWSMLWGWPGLVLSTPLTVCVVVLGRYVPQLSFLHSLLGTTATLSPAAHLYERLLAMDQTEAWAVAEAYLDGKPLVRLYDSVILPVLALAEEDRHKGVLTDVRWNFVMLTIEELVARLSEYQPTSSGDSKPTRRMPATKQFAVVCISAGDMADDLAAVMLAQLLEHDGQPALMLSANGVSDEILRGLAAEKGTLVVLSALPPFAFAHTRGLCQRVRTQMPENRIAVALWNSKEDPEDLLARFGSYQPEAVVSTLTQTLRQAEEWQRVSIKS